MFSVKEWQLKSPGQILFDFLKRFIQLDQSHY